MVARGKTGRGVGPCFWTHAHSHAHNSQSSHRIGRCWPQSGRGGRNTRFRLNRPSQPKRGWVHYQKNTPFDVKNLPESEMLLTKPQITQNLFTVYCRKIKETCTSGFCCFSISFLAIGQILTFLLSFLWRGVGPFFEKIDIF